MDKFNGTKLQYTCYFTIGWLSWMVFQPVKGYFMHKWEMRTFYDYIYIFCVVSYVFAHGYVISSISI